MHVILITKTIFGLKISRNSYFKNEHPHSILTSYPIESNGDLLYYDLSEEYFKTTDSRYNSFSVRSRRLERVNKFEARQAKKDKLV